MIKILSIGLGGVGVVTSYVLQNFNPEVEITAVIRSDYDHVMKSGYTISSIDYGGRRLNDNPNEADNSIKGFKPKNIVKKLTDATKFGPFDYIVVATKVIPKEKDNVWDQVEQLPELFKDEKGTSIVLIQNGIDPERFWEGLKDKAIFISGVSYISSVNHKGTVTQYGHDDNNFGLIYEDDNPDALEEFLGLYTNDYNSVGLDTNVRLTRWKKLLYNASFNTVCCLTDMDVGKIFDLKDSMGIIDNLVRPLMKEIQYVANYDLKTNYPNHKGENVTDDDIGFIITATEDTDAKNNYQPSMLVDSRNGRNIELEVILGNVIKIHKLNTNGDMKSEIPYLTLMYYLLSLVQYRLSDKQNNSK
mmetsp:Transcript_6231/g.7705  ORF Transcript_6231/g.7705 Transcript_6231/m.7705 type:complete len:360 (+) Transcript_6231:42-1121(+)